MNTIVNEPDHECRVATPAELHQMVRLLFCIRVLRRRFRHDPSEYLWRIKHKVAVHLYRVLLRRAGESDLNALPKLGGEEKRQLLQRHPLLQRDRPTGLSSGPDSDWMHELQDRVARFADRIRHHRSVP